MWLAMEIKKTYLLLIILEVINTDRYSSTCGPMLLGGGEVRRWGAGVRVIKVVPNVLYYYGSSFCFAGS